ncbi:MAG: hypothetical protein ACR2G8_01735 [Candidatus Limnocylindria bacterium]|nr:hypothetical protein [Chloroflexota bacterium]MDQ3400665.1 hypothetical protein [Chloroflexota bacterium]
MQQLRTVLGSRLDAGTAITVAALAIAFVIAEQLYKFHSFTLETIAFLATWWLLRRVGLLLFSPR